MITGNISKALCLCLPGLVLAACTEPRPMGATCDNPQLETELAMGNSFRRTVETQADAAPEEVQFDIIIDPDNDEFRNRVRQIFEDPAKDRIAVLTVSAGGEWGAFGAGFMRGLALSRDGSKTYDVVTGVSTGALVAPLIFTGREQDIRRLREEYTQVGDRQLIRRRGKLALLSSNSLYSTKTLRERVDQVISPDLVREIAKGVRPDEETGVNPNRRLAVMAINMDTGRPKIFDLTAIAAGEGEYASLSEEDRRSLIKSAVLASSAVPIGFPPQFINDEMYVDGGARQHVFVGSEIAASMAPEDRREELGGGKVRVKFTASEGISKPVDLYVLVNGDFRTLPDCTENDLFGIAGRTASIAVNQLLFNSVLSLMTIADDTPGWDAREADAWSVTAVKTGARPGDRVEGKCAVPVGDDVEMFNQPFMACLYERACALAAMDGEAAWSRGLNALRDRRPPGDISWIPVPEECRVEQAVASR